MAGFVTVLGAAFGVAAVALLRNEHYQLGAGFGGVAITGGLAGQDSLIKAWRESSPSAYAGLVAGVGTAGTVFYYAIPEIMARL